MNFKNKSFLGDSVTLSLGFLIAYIFIKSYNLKYILYADEIFLIMSLPGYELIRLAFTRILKKRHPFKADSNHIHHLIIKRLGFIKAYLIIQLLLIIPYLLFISLRNFYFSIITSLILYCYVIYLFKKRFHETVK